VFRKRCPRCGRPLSSRAHHLEAAESADPARSSKVYFCVATNSRVAYHPHLLNDLACWYYDARDRLFRRRST
jgi:hypothetical protein